MIVRLYTPKPAHVDLLPKIIEVRRKDTRWVSHVVSNGATLASYTKTCRCRHSLQQVAADKNPSYLDFHEHVILKDMPYFHLKLEPLADLANCFMPYVPSRRTVRPRQTSARRMMCHLSF
jgi:hypothetical protein